MSRIISSVEKMARSIGFDIGCSDDNCQSDLLNGFCEGLNDSMLKQSDRNIQYCYIAEKLDKKTLKVLSEIVEFIKVKEQ